MHSLSNQNLINLSSSCPRLDYTPFIRCCITLTLTLLCHSSPISESHLCLEGKQFFASLWVSVQSTSRRSLLQSLHRLCKHDSGLIFRSGVEKEDLKAVITANHLQPILILNPHDNPSGYNFSDSCHGELVRLKEGLNTRLWALHTIKMF